MSVVKLSSRVYPYKAFTASFQHSITVCFQAEHVSTLRVLPLAVRHPTTVMLTLAVDIPFRASRLPSLHIPSYIEPRYDLVWYDSGLNVRGTVYLLRTVHDGTRHGTARDTQPGDQEGEGKAVGTGAFICTPAFTPPELFGQSTAVRCVSSCL